ncbi:unnamed protein product [Strongylus vulgaris]|uniref:EGF-like domain-containing protein n=1 Tax=Strongylus vulgaris TaxID=40348 RepID=A0A3P7IRR5_STRVU|nr:unnamed protein product [Strongylus vulgaris]
MNLDKDCKRLGAIELAIYLLMLLYHRANKFAFEGFVCICPPEYTGDRCQIRSSKCKGEDCNSGICVERDDTWQCVCPLNTSGLRCEIINESAVDALGFQQDTSFVSIPGPKNLDQLEASVKPHDVQNEHILLYLANDYDPKSNKHLSVSVVDGAIMYSYSDGKGVYHFVLSNKSFFLPSTDHCGVF